MMIGGNLPTWSNTVPGLRRARGGGGQRKGPVDRLFIVDR